MGEWWRNAYVDAPASALVDRFFAEARASLPSLSTINECQSIDDVFAAVALKQDQQVPEWEGVGGVIDHGA